MKMKKKKYTQDSNVPKLSFSKMETSNKKTRGLTMPLQNFPLPIDSTNISSKFFHVLFNSSFCQKIKRKWMRKEAFNLKYPGFFSYCRVRLSF